MFERDRIQFIFFSILPFLLSSYLFKDLFLKKMSILRKLVLTLISSLSVVDQRGWPLIYFFTIFRD